MKITCQSCGAQYAIADEKVLGRKVRVRCKSCSTAIVVDGTRPAESPYGGAEDDDEATRIEGPPAFTDQAADPDAWSVNLSDTDQRTMTTDEIVGGWHSGVVTEDAFVWKDGMTDWLPVLDVAELYDAVSGGVQAQPPPPAAAAPPPVFGSFGDLAPEAARLSGGRTTGGADLFGGFAEAGSEQEPAGNALAQPAQHPYDDKPTGARNESSVLFSLDALKAGFSSQSAKAPPPQHQQGGGKTDLQNLMGIGGGGDNALFALGANQALLTAPAPEPEPPPPPPPPSIPPPGHAASVRPPQTGRSNKMLITIAAIAAGAFGLVVVLGVMLALSLGHKKSGKVAVNDKKGQPTSSQAATPTAQAEPDKKKEETQAEATKNDKTTEAAGSDGGTTEKGARTDETARKTFASPEEKKRYFEAKKKEEAAKKKKATAKPTEAPAKKNEVPTSFNKGAAIRSLTSAAAAAASCKRPGGPTGRGRAIVTFAPSGRVTSANVTGGSFGGTSVGGCVASVFRHAHIPAFGGHAVTVSKSFTIPE